MGRTRKLRLKGGQGVGEKRSRTEFQSSMPVNPCADPVVESFMAYHLKADIKHDHGDLGFLEASSEDVISGSAPPEALKEESVHDYFLRNFDPVKNDVRKRNILNFNLSEKTDLFPNTGIDSVFRPFSNISSSEIAVLQDAGFQLYRAMNSINLITFGSILDQAGKPKENAYYFPSNAELTFPLCVFGFNPENVQDITITKFKGTSVECSFKSTKFGPGGSGGEMQLNQLQGDFRSIAQIKSLSNNEKYRAIIGKALGDALLVASLVPNIGGIENKLYPKQRVTSLEDTSKTKLFKKILFNTGDRLAHTRAYAFGVPSVYSPPSKKGIRDFEFIPGVDFQLTPQQLNGYYLELINETVDYVDKVYTDLINHLSNEVLKDGKIDVSKTKKSGTQLVTDIDYATKLITILIQNVIKIRDGVKIYCQTKYTTRKDTYKAYIDLLKESINFVPASTTTLNKHGDVLLALNILKTQNPIKIGATTLKGTYTFYVSEVYQASGNLSSRLSAMFTLFGDVLPSRSTVGGQQKVEEIFGVPFTGPTAEFKNDKVEPLTEFLEESYLPQASSMKWSEVYEAYQTYQTHPQSILDETLFESLFNEYSSLTTDSERFREHSNIDNVTHTRSSLKFNAFACRFNASIAGEDTDFGKELLDYAAKFEELMNTKPNTGSNTPPRPPPSAPATLATIPFSSVQGTQDSSMLASPMSAKKKEDTDTDTESSHPVQTKLIFGSGLDLEHSFVKKVGGQRVERENFSIDETKSFVKVGGYPSSVVK